MDDLPDLTGEKGNIMEEERRILKERPEIREFFLAYLTLNDKQQKGVEMFVELIGKGMEKAEAAAKSAAYLMEHGDTRSAEVFLNYWS